jgi:hypothetical protein
MRAGVHVAESKVFLTSTQALIDFYSSFHRCLGRLQHLLRFTRRLCDCYCMGMHGDALYVVQHVANKMKDEKQICQE